VLRSMFSAISGLRANQTKIDVTGNNIANVNTVGYKSSNTVFQDTLSQVIRAGGAPAEDRGGTNPAQVGLGVKVAAITTNWTQGATQSTGRSTDFMIEGDGFFVTRSGTEQLFTRAGSFGFDGNGKLVTPDGGTLQGWMADNGTVDSNRAVTDLSVPYGQIVPPRATGSTVPAAPSGGALAGNLPANAATGDVVQRTVTMYDELGMSQEIAYTFTKQAAAGAWLLDVTRAGTATPVIDDEPVTFDPLGVMTAPAGGTVAFTPSGAPASLASWPGTVTIDLRAVTQYGGSSTIEATGQDGFAVGSLQSFTLGNDGTITGVYSNGLRQPLGKLALASFNNPGGLEKAGSSSFRVGDNSGAAMIGLAGVAGRGELVSGALEMSNVDLAEEFTGLIVAQRGFQANSRVITSSDEILQDLVNLKR